MNFQKFVQDRSFVRKLDIEKFVPLTKSFIWNSVKSDRNNSLLPTTCRNSIQGKTFIADDEGIVYGRMSKLVQTEVNIISTYL